MREPLNFICVTSLDKGEVASPLEAVRRRGQLDNPSLQYSKEKRYGGTVAIA